MSTQSLSTRAMLVNLTITSWTARKRDLTVTAEVAQQHNTTGDVGAYNKKLFPGDAPSYKAVIQSLNEMRIYHYINTSPWLDDGARILSAQNFMEYSAGMRRRFNNADNLLPVFYADYPALQSNAQRMLNGLWKAEDYPALDELKDKFSYKYKILPLPDAKDFRVQLGDDDIADIRAEIEQTSNLAIHNATADLYKRLHTVVANMVERLSDDKAVFRDSLVLNARELCELLPRLNIEDDAQLEALRTKVESSLTQFEPEELREDKGLRKATAIQARKIQDDMAAIMGVQP